MNPLLDQGMLGMAEQRLIVLSMLCLASAQDLQAYLILSLRAAWQGTWTNGVQHQVLKLGPCT